MPSVTLLVSGRIDHEVVLQAMQVMQEAGMRVSALGLEAVVPIVEPLDPQTEVWPLVRELIGIGGHEKAQNELRAMGVTDIASLARLRLEDDLLRNLPNILGRRLEWSVAAKVLRLMVENRIGCANVNPAELFKTPVANLVFAAEEPQQTRILNGFKRNNIEWLELLAYLPEASWSNLPNLGNKSIARIKEVAARYLIYPKLAD